jgi:RecA-family ATPase
MNDQTKFRLAMLQNGYDPLPAVGKRPVQEGWPQRLNLSEEEICRMETQFPTASNTGNNCERTPGLDIDIMDPEAAEAITDEIKDWCGSNGDVLMRIGSPPKFLVPFRVDAPITKMIRSFTAPNGAKHKIELLGKGQQFIANGVHPDIKKNYWWLNSKSLDNTPRDSLPLLTEAEAVKLLDYLSDVLIQGHGYTLDAATGGNGHGTEHAPFDLDADLKGIHFGNIDDTINRAAWSLLRKGITADETYRTIMNALDGSLACQADPKKASWGRAVTDKIYQAIRDEPTFRPSLSTDMQRAWNTSIEAGERPQLTWVPKNNAFHVRSYKDHAAAKNETAEPSEPPRDKVKQREPFTLNWLKPFNPLLIPQREWVYGKHYQRGTVSLTAAPGGMGKSSMDLVEAIAMATGRDLLGEQPQEKLRVWFHNREDPLVETLRRVAAVCQHFNIPMEEWSEHLVVTSSVEFPFKVARGYTNLEIEHTLVQQMSAAIGKMEIDVAIFDPLVTLHSVSEMDTGKMDAVIRIFAGIAEENNCAIDLAHHVRKPAAGAVGDYDVHDIRGVKAITDAVRAARLLNHMSEKDADAAGCDERERLAKFRVDRAKGNYSPAQAATWRQFVDIEIPNGDHVGVVTLWSFPGQGERTEHAIAMERTAEQVFLHLLDKYAARNINVSTHAGPNHAPSKFAKEPEAKKAKVAKAHLDAAMLRLLDAKQVAVEPIGRGDRNAHRLVVVIKEAVEA